MLNESKLKRIEDQNKLVQLFKTSQEIEDKISIIHYLKSQKILKELFALEQDDFVKAELIKKITSKPFVKSVILNVDESDFVRCYGLERINNIHIFKKILKGASIKLIREVVNHIQDQSLLQEIYKENSDHIVRKRVITNIMDEDFLNDVILNDDSYMVKVEALKKIQSIDNLVKYKLLDSGAFHEVISKRLEELTSY